MKYCSKCDQLLPYSDFYKCSRNKDGAQSRCKACYSTYYKKNQKDILQKAQNRYALQGDIVKQRCKDYESKNREKVLARKKKYYKNNKTVILDKQKRYRQEHADIVANSKKREYQKNKLGYIKRAMNRRAIIASRSQFIILDKEMRRLKTSPCVHCGSLDNIQVDHIIPIIKGGEHRVGNLQSLCASCNGMGGKGTMLMAEWKMKRSIIN